MGTEIKTKKQTGKDNKWYTTKSEKRGVNAAEILAAQMERRERSDRLRRGEAKSLLNGEK